MILLRASVLLLIVISTTAQAQILVDETWGASTTKASLTNYDDVSSLRGTKKLGLQTTLGGAAGLVGLNLEINFSDKFTLSLGPGLSRGFQSANLHIKRFWSGREFAPYFIAGYSRWYSKANEDGVKSTAPSVLAKKFLSRREIETGEFAENIIYPGLGLQYVNRSGDWQGLGFFAEVLFLLDLDDIETGVTAGVGSVYYF